MKRAFFKTFIKNEAWQKKSILLQGLKNNLTASLVQKKCPSNPPPPNFSSRKDE